MRISDEQVNRSDISSASGDSNAQRGKLPLIDTGKEASPGWCWQKGDGPVEEGTTQWRQSHWAKLPEAFSVTELDLFSLIVKNCCVCCPPFTCHHAPGKHHSGVSHVYFLSLVMKLSLSLHKEFRHVTSRFSYRNSFPPNTSWIFHTFINVIDFSKPTT